MRIMKQALQHLRNLGKSNKFLFVGNMKKEVPIVSKDVSKDPKHEQGEQLHLDIEVPDIQTEIDFVLAEGDVIMSSDEEEPSVPKIITTQELKNERDKRRRIKGDFLGRIGKMLQ